jgi:hypothetical protein
MAGKHANNYVVHAKMLQPRQIGYQEFSAQLTVEL